MDFMDRHSPVLAHTRRRRTSCPPSEGESKGSLLPVVVLLGGVVCAVVIWRDRKRVREAEEAGDCAHRRSDTGTSGEKSISIWQRVIDLFWRPSPSLSYKGRACGALAQGREEAEEEGGAESAGQEGESAHEVTDVGPVCVQKFEGGRWHVLSRSAACHFVPSSGPPSTSPDPQNIGRCGWSLKVGPARNPYVEADVSADLQLREAPGEGGVKFKWEGGFWSLQFPNRPALALFLTAFRAKREAAHALSTSAGGNPVGNSSSTQAAGQRRRGGDVRIEDILA